MALFFDNSVSSPVFGISEKHHFGLVHGELIHNRKKGVIMSDTSKALEFSKVISTKKDEKSQSIKTNLTVIVDVKQNQLLTFAKRAIIIAVQTRLRGLSEIPTDYSVKVSDLIANIRHKKTKVEKAADLMNGVDKSALTDAERKLLSGIFNKLNQQK